MEGVWDQHDDDISLGGYFIGGGYLEPCCLSASPRLTALKLANNDLAAAIPQVLRLGMSLAAKANDANDLAPD
jgi:hypothetical protein